MNTLRFSIIAVALALTAALCPIGADAAEKRSDPILQYHAPDAASDDVLRNTIEIYGDRNSINHGFGDWDSFGMRYTRQETGYSYLFELNGYNRSEGLAGQLLAALYKDWGPSFYTFTSISGATNVTYVPRFRIDQDFNFKLGEKKDWVWVVGASYINYHTDAQDTIFSTGITRYLPGWMFTYRFFYNISDPGAVDSTSHLFSVDQGTWYKYMNTLTYSFGNQAFLATYFDSPSVVDRNSWSLLFRHRHWLTKDRGFWIQVGALGVENGYDGFNVGCGLFFSY